VTNLLIAIPQITTDATAVYTYEAADASYPVNNLVCGPRSSYTKLAAVGNSEWVKFDLGSSQSKTIDFYIVAKANLLKAGGSFRLKLSGSTIDATPTTNAQAYTDICGTNDGLQSLTLYGPRSEDAIFTADLANSTSGPGLPVTASYRFFRHAYVGFGASPMRTWKHSKCYFGQWFDPGKDPIRPSRVEKIIKDKNDRESVYLFTFTWEGITDAKRNEFFTNLFNDRQRGVFLYTKNYHDLLLEHRLIHCFVADFSVSRTAPDSHSITVTFEEMI